MKRKIKIVDSLFSHSLYSTNFQESKYIEWDRTFISNKDKMVFLLIIIYMVLDFKV